MKKEKIIITGKMIEIKGTLARHKIVQKVVNTFIKTEYRKKGRDVIFQYPVENLLDEQLFIVRPGHKKNFDFKVGVITNLGLGKGSHIEIATDLRKKKQKNLQKFGEVLNAITQIYDCLESDADKILSSYPDMDKSFQTGAKVEVILYLISLGMSQKKQMIIGSKRH